MKYLTKIHRPLEQHRTAWIAYIFFSLIFLVGCISSQPRVTVEQQYDNAFEQGADDILHLTVKFEDEQIKLRIYGFEEAKKQAKARPVSSRRLWVIIYPSSGKIVKGIWRGQPRKITLGLDPLHARNIHSAKEFDAYVELIGQAYHTSLVLIPMPGSFGSTGDFARSNDPAAFQAMNQAIDQLKSLLQLQKISLFGQSAAGNILAGLLTQRNDLSCVVIASAPLDQKNSNKPGLSI